MADPEAETTDGSSSEETGTEELTDEELLDLEDDLFELEDSLVEMQGTTIRSSEKEAEEEESKIQKVYTFNKHDEEEGGEEGGEDETIEAQLDEFSESMENLEEVKPGQLLAADLTEDGEPRFEPGRYVRATADGRRLFAGRPGQVVWSGDTVHVLPIMHIDGDVDSDTGDVRYDGNIFIEGMVADNRLVEARGNIWVMGVVGRARLKASGDIIIQGGIKGGEKQKIEAHGLVYGKFAENARIKAGSKVIIKEVIMHSNINADESIILADQDANIVGGETSAGKLIVANDLGSVSYPETKFRMGAKGVLQEELEKLEDRRDRMAEEVEEKEKNVNSLKKKADDEGLSPSDENRLRELEFELNHAREDLQQVKHRVTDIEDELDSEVQREIIVRGTIYPGVKLHIGSVREPVEDERSHCTVKVEEKEIKFDSFKEPEEDLDFSPSIGEDLEDYEEKYETPDLADLRRHVIFEETEPLFNREEQLRLLIGIDDEQELALVDLNPELREMEADDAEETEEVERSWWGVEVRADENKESVRHYFDPNAQDSVKVRCKSPKEGLRRASEYLGESEENLAVKILEEGRAGILGIGEKDYLIRVIKKDRLESSAEEGGSEEKSETFDLLEEAEQQEDVAGFINLENTTDGLKLTVYPPQGHGLPVSLDQVKEELEENNYDQDIDWVKVEELVEDPSGEPEIIGPRQRDPKIDGSFSVNVNDHETEAYLTVIPPKPEGVPVTRDEVEEYLEDERIDYNEDKLDEVFEEEKFEEEILIAAGKDPVHGRDGEINYQFDVENLFEEEEEEETVDHHEGEQIVSVEEGEVLAEVVSPTDGEAGISIYGDEIPPEPGDNIDIEAGENVKFSDDGTELIADREGRVRLEGEEGERVILVEPVLEISGDLDYEVGNVEFDGVVIVKGMILDGFKVVAKQRVEAEAIGKAHVESGGDIVVDQGIVGRDEGKVEAEGNIFAKYVENARLKAGGSVVVDQAIMHSKADAEKYIIVDGQRRGDIIGGVARAGEAIQAQNIGAKLASKTEVESGISPELRDRVSKLEDEIQEQKGAMDRIRSGLKGLQDAADKVGGMENLPEDKQELRSKLGTRAKAVKKRIKTLGEELENLKAKIEEMSGGEIRVEDTLMSGVKMTIQTTTMYLTDDHVNCKFILYKNDFSEKNFEPLDVEIERPT